MIVFKQEKILYHRNMYALPKKVNRTEAELDMRVARRVAQVHTQKNWALEVKMEGKKPSPHQRAALKQVENGTFLYKLPDKGQRNPFDIIHLGDADAIVCTIKKNKRDVSCVVNGYYEFGIRI
jgi:hypothetical protein